MPAITPHAERFPIIGWVAHFQFVAPDARPHLLHPVSRSFATESAARVWLAAVRRTAAPSMEIAACVCPVRVEVTCA